MTVKFSELQLLGQSQTHLCSPSSDIIDSKCLIHHAMLDDWTRLQQAASNQGVNLQIASSFRSFERQLAIWNAKACGQRLLNDRANRPLSFASLSNQELLDAILTWSALPGASRHHWGCDIDVYDPDMLGDKSLKLEPWEYQPGGPMAKLGQWLAANIEQYGFYQPYRTDRGGVAIEPWHISHIALSSQAIKQFTPAVLQSALAKCDIGLKALILSQLTQIFDRYIDNTDQP